MTGFGYCVSNNRIFGYEIKDQNICPYCGDFLTHGKAHKLSDDFAPLFKFKNRRRIRNERK